MSSDQCTKYGLCCELYILFWISGLAFLLASLIMYGILSFNGRGPFTSMVIIPMIVSSILILLGILVYPKPELAVKNPPHGKIIYERDGKKIEEPIGLPIIIALNGDKALRIIPLTQGDKDE